MNAKRTQLMEATVIIRHTLELHEPADGDEGMPYVWACGGCGSRKRMNFPKPDSIPSHYELECAACGQKIKPAEIVKALND